MLSRDTSNEPPGKCYCFSLFFFFFFTFPPKTSIILVSTSNSVFSLLAPILEQRLDDMKKPDFKTPPDLIQLVIDGSPDGKGRNLDYQVSAQVGTGRAALFTTATTVFHILYDLCIRPEYIEPLRKEALDVGEVSMTRANVAKLVKLDSFIREAQRFNKFMLGTLHGLSNEAQKTDCNGHSWDYSQGYKAIEDCNRRSPASRCHLWRGHPL